MTKKATRVDVNNFVGGINTEASPLNFPAGASLDEENFDLKKNGLRERRLGIDYEAGFGLVDTGLTESAFSTAETSSFKWTGVAGSADNNFIVSQVGNTLFFFDAAAPDLSTSGYLGNLQITEFLGTDQFSFAAIDGFLIVVSGEERVVTVTYDSDAGTFSKTAGRIKVRDLWGIEVVGSEYETNPQFRGTTIPSEHIYNLRNQSWAYPRFNDPRYRDPIDFYFLALGKYPSNSESVWQGMFTPSSLRESFSPNRLRDVVGADFVSAKGFFIIDLLKRGNSRLEEYTKNQVANPELVHNVSLVPEDVTTSGAKVVTEYAGRVWYGGFGGEVVNGDSRSPNLASYIFFSQIVNSPQDIFKCYQSGDPTSRESSDIVDTDGGFIRISGAVNINGMVPIGKDLIVIASNGVWAVTGGSDFGFTATNYSVTKLSTFGCIASNSIVTEGDNLYYWSEDGIYSLQRNQLGDKTVDSISKNTIQTLYDEIPNSSKQKVRSGYDPFERKIKWLYSSDATTPNKFDRELILDLNLTAYTKNRIYPLAVNSPRVIGVAFTEPFLKGVSVDDVVVEGVEVVAAGVDVVISQQIRSTGFVSTRYLTAVIRPSGIFLTFSQYRNPGFKDWEQEDGVGVDAKAFVLTGSTTMGDSGVVKQVQYLIMHFLRTENSIENGIIQNQSSCLVRSQWDWANSINSNKWGPLFQAYRFRRLFLSATSDFDTGFETVVTKNKLRGRGRAFSMYIETEPAKDCRILGWNLSVDGNAIT